MESTGILSVVATPIGNLEDITLRAIRILQAADLVLCEDTRVTGKLLHQYDIQTKMSRYDAHTSESRHAEVLERLSAGEHIALVSDAGTPGVSDPGVMLVARAREAGARIEVIPGPSAVTAAFSIAGIAGNQFSFLGFAPQKKGRETFFRELPDHVQPVMFFESTHRIRKTLDALAAVSATARIHLARELTKLHEDMFVGTAAELIERLDTDPVKQKGEFVVIFDAR